MARAIDVGFEDNALRVDLNDGRRLLVPLTWYPRLLEATSAQREEWELLDAGAGIRWAEIDEDLSVAGLLAGREAPGGSKRVG